LAATHEKKFSILISHGHDDHCDDDFLSLFPKETRVITAEFLSPGTKNRIRSIGFNNVVEVPFDGVPIGKFFIRSLVDTKESLYDSAFVIASKRNVIIHQNDNWKPYRQEFADIICKDISSFHASGNVLFMSQCNLADAFPLCYEDYTMEERHKIAEERRRKMVFCAFDNATRIGARFFLNYAGHAKSYTFNGWSGAPQTLNFINMNMPNSPVRLLDMIPGDKFDFQDVKKMFGNSIDEELLAKSSEKYYKKYDIVKKTDCHVYTETTLSRVARSKKVKRFLRLFNEYVSSKVEKRSDFRPGIFNSVLAIEDESTGTIHRVKLGEQKVTSKDKSHTHLIVSATLLDAFLEGKINWENLYIGSQCKVKKLDKNYNNGDIMRWLAMFGYVYQKFYT
jgi:hypothetical protein